MRIVVNCGHTKTGAGSGAVGFINESNETRNVGYLLMDLLRKAGHEVIDATVNSAVQIYLLVFTLTLEAVEVQRLILIKVNKYHKPLKYALKLQS